MGVKEDEKYDLNNDSQYLSRVFVDHRSPFSARRCGCPAGRGRAPNSTGGRLRPLSIREFADIAA